MLRNCADCDKIFSHPTQRYCPSCLKARSDDFSKVRDYLRKNPHSTTSETSEATEVDLDTIMGYIRSGRLTIVPSDSQLSCELCGKTIKKGRLCSNCGQDLTSPAVDSSLSKKQDKGGIGTEKKAKMHTLDQIRKRY